MPEAGLCQGKGRGGRFLGEESKSGANRSTRGNSVGGDLAQRHRLSSGLFLEIWKRRHLAVVQLFWCSIPTPPLLSGDSHANIT